MRALVFAFITSFLNHANAQLQTEPADSGSVREVSVSNLQQNGKTMIALTFGHSNAGNYYWIRQVKEATFGDTTFFAGYRGDEDQGQMGALSTLMAVGLFDVQELADTNPTLEITSPIFDKIRFHLPGKKTFVIQTTSPAGKDNTYIQSATLNSKTWNSFELPFKTFANGGSLNIKLGPQPNKAWVLRFSFLFILLLFLSCFHK